jgi:ankyrin repeat protein
MSLFEDFTLAIERGDSSKVKSLISRDSIDVNARLPRDKRPPALVFAAHLGCKDVVDVLLRAGARINDVDDEQQTACHVVALRGRSEQHVAVLELLLTHRPDLGLKCKRKHTPLEVSLMSQGGQRISIMLVEGGAPLDGVDRRLLCQLAATSTTAIQTLLQRRVAVSELRDRDQHTPLHFAAALDTPDSVAVLDMLVNECGVDLEVHDSLGNTCTHIAQLHDNADALRFFIAAGVNLQSVNNSTLTPLHLMGDEKCAILLLAGGADLDARDELGRTPCIEMASLFWRERDLFFVRSIMNVMIAAGADLDAADDQGETARELLADFEVALEGTEVETARREIAKVRLDFVRHRAWQVCIGLQSRGLDALQMCEILVHACGPVAPLIPFHQWWKLATTVKHFKSF